MTLTHTYCTVDAIRGQLSDKDAKVDDIIVERAINATSRAVDDWCHRMFLTPRYVEGCYGLGVIEVV